MVSNAESGFPKGTLLPNLTSPGPDEAHRSTLFVNSSSMVSGPMRVASALLPSVSTRRSLQLETEEFDKHMIPKAADKIT